MWFLGDEDGVKARVAALSGAALGLVGARQIIVAEIAAD